MAQSADFYTKKILSDRKGIIPVYLSIVPAMLAGRAVSGLIKWILLLGSENSLTLHAFWHPLL